MAGSRLIVVSGASRGVGVGICRQALALDSTAEVVVTARNLDQARAVRDELNAEIGQGPARAHALRCDVTDDSSCEALAAALSDVGGPTDRPFSLVNNAGVAHDLPWLPSPWPASAASDTLAVNLFGAERLTRALLPRLLASRDGRVVFVSSGGGRANMSRMDSGPRENLMSEDLAWDDVRRLADTFRKEYEAAAVAAAQADGPQLPFVSSSGLWLQSYGFSKACLGAYCQIVARKYPSLLCVACSPGFIGTDMTRTYDKYDELKSPDEGGNIEAWLATGEKSNMQSGVFYQPDRTMVSWVAGVELDKGQPGRQ